MLTKEQIEQIDNMLYLDKCELAESTDDIDTLNKLSNDEHWNVRYRVASNAHTPIATLNKLSNDDNCDVRYHVALNKHTPIDTLNKLSYDDDPYVQYRAEKQIKIRTYEASLININRHTTKGILE